MDLIIMKKRLSSYRTEGGRLRGMSDDLLLEVLKVWENWTGSAKELGRELGLTHRQLGPLIGKAKKLQRTKVQPSTEVPPSVRYELKRFFIIIKSITASFYLLSACLDKLPPFNFSAMQGSSMIYNAAS